MKNKSRIIKRGVEILILICILNPGISTAQKSAVKPNVIIIYTDDQGTIDANCYGAKDLYTPNIDRLADSGVRFTQFYAAAAICSPSRINSRLVRRSFNTAAFIVPGPSTTFGMALLKCVTTLAPRSIALCAVAASDCD